MAEPVPISVWPVAQHTSRSQRAGRYLPVSGTHPAKMLPALAAGQIDLGYVGPGPVLGAAVGATRAVTDAGWVPSSLQVGLTGATIAPDLYITVGISGAVQHIAGISGARNVVAINRDADANIFKYARFAVENLNAVFGWMHAPWSLPDPSTLMPFGMTYLLPVGISFSSRPTSATRCWPSTGLVAPCLSCSAGWCRGCTAASRLTRSPSCIGPTRKAPSGSSPNGPACKSGCCG